MKNLKFKMKGRNSGITLISLVITIVVLLILAGVTINLTIGNNGIFKIAKQAAKNYTDEQNKELAKLNQFNNDISSIIGGGTHEETLKTATPNKPSLLTGMTPIKFTVPTDTTEGTVVQTTVDDVNWYNYEDRNWANAQTADGSMWVWIPRYAYRINKGTQTCDIVFLIGSTDNYYDENGQLQTAKRQTKVDEIIDTSIGYTVHPAFTDESSINFANGGWDKELAGLWVAKFEAGYAGGNNTATKGVSSGVNYTQFTVPAPAVETGTGKDDSLPARNWTDGEYGDTPTAIKYPTFQGTTFAMNYINSNDAFNVSKSLTKSGNIYGFNNEQTDSHLIKNSEWSAIAYLSQSKYGLNGTDIYINSISLENSTQSVYAVTGCCAKTADSAIIETTIDAINNRTANCYVWTQKIGQRASSTGTIYGIYDLSGGLADMTASYVRNEHSNLKAFGSSISYDGNNLKTNSTKYTIAYSYDPINDNINIDDSPINLDRANAANYQKNLKIYGNALSETSTSGITETSWYGACSWFPGLYAPFLMRGGDFGYRAAGGLFSFDRLHGFACSRIGFRTVLCTK